ncbi:hypothetical protein PFISCL1PPCAC_19247, partial [Pristionchus fissidentatus]
ARSNGKEGVREEKENKKESGEIRGSFYSQNWKFLMKKNENDVIYRNPAPIRAPFRPNPTNMGGSSREDLLRRE